jgi:hypothetical protein
LSLLDFAFLLFHVLDSAPLIKIEHSFYFCSQHNLSNSSTIFYFVDSLFAFEMGVKFFRAGTNVREASTILSFKFATIVSSLPIGSFSNSPRSCRLCRDAFFQIQHNTLNFTALPSFVFSRYF